MKPATTAAYIFKTFYKSLPAFQPGTASVLPKVKTQSQLVFKSRSILILLIIRMWTFDGSQRGARPSICHQIRGSKQWISLDS